MPANHAALPSSLAHSSSFWSAPTAPAQVPAFSSSFQNSLLLAYVRGFLEPSKPESCADASRTFQNISRASDHVRTPFLDPEHPDTQPEICSPANAAWPQFRIRHPDLDSFGGLPTRPRMGTLGNLPRRTRTCPRMSSVTCADCCSSRGDCDCEGAGGARGA